MYEFLVKTFFTLFTQRKCPATFPQQASRYKKLTNENITVIMIIEANGKKYGGAK